MMQVYVKKNLGKIILAFLFLLTINACSYNESKIKGIVDREIGSGLIVERARLELEKQLGRNHSKLKSSLLETVSKKIKIDYEQIIIEGRRARVHVKAEIPRLEDIGALFSEARNIPRDKLIEFNTEELVKEINKTSRRPASRNELQTELYEFYIDFEKTKEWIPNRDQLGKAYSRKNLVAR